MPKKVDFWRSKSIMEGWLLTKIHVKLVLVSILSLVYSSDNQKPIARSLEFKQKAIEELVLQIHHLIQVGRTFKKKVKVAFEESNHSTHDIHSYKIKRNNYSLHEK